MTRRELLLGVSVVIVDGVLVYAIEKVDRQGKDIAFIKKQVNRAGEIVSKIGSDCRIEGSDGNTTQNPACKRIAPAPAPVFGG